MEEQEKFVYTYYYDDQTWYIMKSTEKDFFRIAIPRTLAEAMEVVNDRIIHNSALHYTVSEDIWNYLTRRGRNSMAGEDYYRSYGFIAELPEYVQENLQKIYVSDEQE